MERHTPLRAAQYVRMSTERQDYSIEGQAAANDAYALAHGLEIVRTYADAGVSGLDLKRRNGLKDLLADVLGARADFSMILVYDVSRWGRFQDPDEAAHYEFLCRSAGVRVEYTAEAFANDGSLTATLVKHLKRAMAAEYSRELSVKISRAQHGLHAKGFWQGGPCGYGFRRRIVNPDGSLGPVMQDGEQKALRGGHTVLVHGPAHEVDTVRRIYRLFVVAGLNPYAIANLLNAEGVPAAAGRPWTSHRIRGVLTSEKYLGVLTLARNGYYLRRRRPAGPESWDRVLDACEPMVSRAMFDLAKRNLIRRKPKVSDEVLLRELKGVLARHGRLSHAIIQADPEAHSPQVYVARFGGLTAAYARIGHRPTPQQRTAAELCRRVRPGGRERAPPRTNDELIAALVRLLAEQGQLSVEIINRAPGVPCAERYRLRFGGMRRAYALAGYRPTPHQEIAMETHGGQALSPAQAEDLRSARKGAGERRQED